MPKKNIFGKQYLPAKMRPVGSGFGFDGSKQLVPTFWYSKTAIGTTGNHFLLYRLVCEIKCGEVQTDRVCSMGKMIRSMHLAQICDRHMKIWTWHGLDRFTCKDDLQNHLSQGPPSSYIYVAPAISKSHTPLTNKSAEGMERESTREGPQFVTECFPCLPPRERLFTSQRGSKYL